MHRSADGRPAAPAPFPASPARFSRPVRRIPCWVLIQRRRTLGRRCVRLVSIETLRNNFFGSKRCCRIDFVAACMHASTTIPCLSNCLAYPQGSQTICSPTRMNGHHFVVMDKYKCSDRSNVLVPPAVKS